MEKMIDNCVELLQGDEPILVWVKNSKYLLQFRLGCPVTHHRDDKEELRELDVAAVVHVVQIEDVRLQLWLRNRRKAIQSSIMFMKEMMICDDDLWWWCLKIKIILQSPISQRVTL